MKVNFCSSCYDDELLDYYPFLNSVNIYAADDEFFNKIGLSDALAATDTKHTIIVRDWLSGKKLKHALCHEAEHIADPEISYALPTPIAESIIDSRARQKSGFNFKVNTYADPKLEDVSNPKFSFTVITYASNFEFKFEDKGKKLPAYLR